MNVVYAKEPIPWPKTCDEWEKHNWEPNSIFLAGPTPRSDDVKSWRPEALEHLEEQGFDGTVFIPEDRDGGFKGTYMDQVDWEHEAISFAGCVLFWVPRDLETLPGFTTNVEFGMLYKTLKQNSVVLGCPPGTPKMRYLLYLAHKAWVAYCGTLSDTVGAALVNLRHPADLRRFVLKGKTSSYHCDTEAGVRRFLGTHLKAAPTLPWVVKFFEDRYGKDVPLHMAVSRDPEGGYDSLNILASLEDMEELSAEDWAEQYDAFIDAWVDWSEKKALRDVDLHVSIVNWPLTDEEAK